jgi:two-component system chemotaxis sensor kinase CheA
MEGHPDLARICHDAEAQLAGHARPPIDLLLRRADEARGWLQDHGLGAQKEDAAEGAAYVTVQTERLDRLLNIAGELTVTTTRLEYEDRAGAPSTETLRILTGLVRGLQEEIMRTRLLPARTLFAGLPRLVRDASKARGVDVDLVLDEGNIGLDRGIVDRFSGVLAHLVQNSVAHGIEPPRERVAAGKPARGSIRLRLRREQETVAVELDDDGRGLDHDAIRTQAVERGIWSQAQAAQATPAELSELVFSAGFSTRQTADSHAGRGIGLTAVRQTVRELGGTLRVESARGQGTRIRIHLPPTVALLDTLVAKAEGTTIALPLRNIRRIRSTGEAMGAGQGMMLLDATRAIPLLTLQGAPAAQGDGRFAVVLEATRGTFALVVDELLGTHAAILKPLDPHLLGEHANAMGAAVLGSGTLVIVLDPNHYRGKA